MDKIVSDFCASCVCVFRDHYGIETSQEELLDGMDKVQKLTQVFLSDLSERCAQYRLSDAEVRLSSQASMFHDIGKLLVDKTILDKPGRLTEAEFEIIKTHPARGLEVLNHVKASCPAFLRTVKNASYMHHERYDGSGYPEGLKGDEIPIYVQVITLADVYDALRSARPYKDAFSHSVALQLIKNGECGAFNPELLKCLDGAEFTKVTADLYDKETSSLDNDDRYLSLDGKIHSAMARSEAVAKYGYQNSAKER